MDCQSCSKLQGRLWNCYGFLSRGIPIVYMYICPANWCSVDFDQSIIYSGLRYRHMLHPNAWLSSSFDKGFHLCYFSSLVRTELASHYFRLKFPQSTISQKTDVHPISPNRLAFCLFHNNIASAFPSYGNT